MPDIIDATGLTVKTAAEITADLQNAWIAIFGSTVNLDQNSPDGQLIGILTQAAVDVREIALGVNASFDPDQAVGVNLDQRVVINNIQRAGGTFTIQPVDITVNATITLQGLDANANSINGTGYTVSDNSGNEFILLDTTTLTAGTTTLNFRAAMLGAVNVPVNTVTNQVTRELPVTAVNNSSAALSVGQNEETDNELRLRRQRSPAILATGYLNGLLAAVLALNGVTGAALYENYTDTTDANGIPPHCIWLIVEGGANSDIANTLYAKISFGCDMRGSVTVDITTASNGLFIAKFDRPSPENLYVAFSIKTTVAGFTFNTTAIKAYIAANQTYSIGAFAETSSLTEQAVAAIAAQGGGGVPVLMTVSIDGSTYTDFIEPSTLASQFTLDPSRITITVLT